MSELPSRPEHPSFVEPATDTGTAETAADFLRRRAGDAKTSDMLWFLDRAANEPPPPGDEMPE
jgi:hypothetical protein